MIQKIIHYCWFGGNPLPELAQKCIASWKKYFPDYEIMLWNENNFDINTVLFTKQIAEIGKWGFIVDYIRAWAVFNYGGIYLDTDVEVIKPFDGLLHDTICFAGFEDKEYVNPGSVFAGEKGSLIAKEIMDYYEKYNIYKNDKLNLIPSPKIFTSILLKHGLAMNNTYQRLNNFTAFPSDYFSPKSPVDGTVNITRNTYSIHWYDGSWLSDAMRQLLKEKQYIDRNITIKPIAMIVKKLCTLKKIIIEKLFT